MTVINKLKVRIMKDFKMKNEVVVSEEKETTVVYDVEEKKVSCVTQMNG